MNRRMPAQASRVQSGSASKRTYSVGTPMNTVAWRISRTAAAASNLLNHSILLPLSRAP